MQHILCIKEYFNKSNQHITIIKYDKLYDIWKTKLEKFIYFLSTPNLMNSLKFAIKLFHQLNNLLYQFIK